MSQFAASMAQRWAAFNEGRPVTRGYIKPYKPQSSGGQRNVSYDRDVFRSYSTIIAQYHTSQTGTLYMVLTDNKHSLTTNKHRHELMSAVRVPYFVVPWLMHNENNNASWLYEQAFAFAEEAKLKWKSTWGHFADHNWEKELERLFKLADGYVQVTGINYAPCWNFKEIHEAVRYHRALRYQQFNDPKAVAKRERARALRLAAKVLIHG